jgi:triacylglycerol lipase
MSVMEKALTREGYRVVNVSYPSRNKPVEELSAGAIETGLVRCALKSGESVHFVTHSMGGILVRHYLAHHKIAALGKVVMLAPPNSGSEVVDHLKNVPAFDLINGPAGSQLGTGLGDLPAQLGPVTYPVGIIAGTQTINPVLSTFLPNPDDGKVSVERTKVQGMTDFIAIKSTHPFITRNQEAIKQTLTFLKSGAFDHGR